MAVKRQRMPSAQQVRVLAYLLDRTAYGYDMMKALDLAPGTLYGLLKRLHEDAFVEKSAEIIEGRCRISYALTPKGAQYANRAILEHEYELGSKAFE